MKNNPLFEKQQKCVFYDTPHKYEMVTFHLFAFEKMEEEKCKRKNNTKEMGNSVPKTSPSPWIYVDLLLSSSMMYLFLIDS